jgi:hypothetical protein
MGAIGAVGGIGGGLGSAGDAGSGGGGDTGPIMDSGPSSDSWYDASSVMQTDGDVSNGTVTLDDGDLSSQYIDDKSRSHDNFPQPPAGGPAPDVAQGVGDSPSPDVISQVASAYAANSQYA